VPIIYNFPSQDQLFLRNNNLIATLSEVELRHEPIRIRIIIHRKFKCRSLIPNFTELSSVISVIKGLSGASCTLYFCVSKGSVINLRKCDGGRGVAAV
jgi:hypothetical protein